MAPTRAVMLHGAGSTGIFIESAFKATALGVDEVVAPDHRDGVEAAITEIDKAFIAARADGAEVTVVGGVSLGAHAAALWAVRREWNSGILVLVMPAWTGEPDHVAAATELASAEVSAQGSTSIVARLAIEAPDDWVVQALSGAWSTYDDRVLARSLSAAARSHAPTMSELTSVRAPTVVIALTDDALHPSRVAHEWARSIPSAVLVTLPRDLHGQGAEELGRASGEAIRALEGGS